MVISLPRRGGGGRGGRGRGCGGHPFLGRERNPRLVCNSSNTTLAVSVSCFPPALSLLPLPALPLPPPLPAIVVYTFMDDVAASAIGSEPDPISGRTSPDDAAAKLT